MCWRSMVFIGRKPRPTRACGTWHTPTLGSELTVLCRQKRDDASPGMGKYPIDQVHIFMNCELPDHTGLRAFRTS